MKRLFITTNEFWKLWRETGLGDDDIKEVEDFLIKKPDYGAVIKSTGGLRKLRWGMKGKGKSGGIRILYADFPKHERLYFITLFKKGEKADLSMNDKNIIARKIKEIEIKHEREHEKRKNKG